MKIIRYAAICWIFLSILSCSCLRKSEQQSTGAKKETQDQVVEAKPPLVVYKTKADYSKNVPVLLACDKTHIISYPHPADLKKGKEFRYPTPLADGYLLDNKGITKDVAFLEYTYEEYASFDTIPDEGTLYWNIIDKDPLTEFCICGSRMSFDGNIDLLYEKIINGDCNCE